MPADVANAHPFKPGAAGPGVRDGDILMNGERPEDNTAVVAAAEARLEAAARAESTGSGAGL